MSATSLASFRGGLVSISLVTFQASTNGRLLLVRYKRKHGMSLISLQPATFHYLRPRLTLDERLTVV